jgi:hypothetical protein
MINPIRSRFAIASLLFTSIGPAGGKAASGTAQVASPIPSASSGQAALSGGTVYLPVVINGQVSSFDLIDLDIQSGKLSAEIGLINKVFTQFSDAHLPLQYQGSGVGREGGRIMEDVVSIRRRTATGRSMSGI